MRKFGLIGYPLSHSFSKKYFTEKFEKEGIQNAQYELYPLSTIEEFPQLLKDNPELVGLNVTIPYKEQIIPFLDEIDEKAKAIGAVNTIKIIDGKLKGFNTDYHGFNDSLIKFFGSRPLPEKAIILGTGGASKAVITALEVLNIECQIVSRSPLKGQINYSDLVQNSTLSTHHLVINTTPLGTFPETEKLPDITYEQLTPDHSLYDLVYNPLITAFMQKGIDANCWVKNGLEMLHGQAEKAWEIWNN